MSDRKSPEIAVMRSMLGRARGLGSAKSGTAHWWAQRVTAIALVPLTLWFVVSLLMVLLGAPRGTVIAWVGHPVTAAVLLALIAASFHHMQLGLQVVIEDYIHADGSRLVWLLVMRALVVMFGLAAAVAVLKLAFTA